MVMLLRWISPSLDLMPLLRDLTNYSAPHLLIHMVRFLDDWVGENSAGSVFSR